MGVLFDDAFGNGILPIVLAEWLVKEIMFLHDVSKSLGTS